MKTKVCPKCKKELPATLEYFYRIKTGKYKLDSYCKSCRIEYSYEYDKNRKGYHKKYYLENRNNLLKSNRKSNYKRLYNINTEEYDQLLKEQNYVCIICGCKEIYKYKGKIKNLAVDHDHKTNKIRGLLCHKCNSMLGYAKDNTFILYKAIKYLINNKNNIILQI